MCRDVPSSTTTYAAKVISKEQYGVPRIDLTFALMSGDISSRVISTLPTD
jgi:hypothetical protein